MRTYTCVMIDIASGEVIAEDSFEYEGSVAELKGPSAPKPTYSASGQIVSGLYSGGGGPLGTSLKNILASPADDSFTQQQADLLGRQARAGYAASGLAGSNIARSGEQSAIGDFMLGRGEQKTNQAINILKTGQESPQFGPQQQQGSGFLGLK